MCRFFGWVGSRVAAVTVATIPAAAGCGGIFIFLFGFCDLVVVVVFLILVFLFEGFSVRCSRSFPFDLFGHEQWCLCEGSINTSRTITSSGSNTSASISCGIV